ncbi:MAG TPA: four helix bundle protein [Planctomycetaceae bacterium]|jgi:four helix bundle protein|nr:four helix bundle protein [Planctomycetaceae bacterium]
MAFAFEKLLVYQQAVDFADQICLRTEHFPRGYGFLVDQLNRAALSMAANIAEGNGRFTVRDRKNFFGIARGSVQECVPILEFGASSQSSSFHRARASQNTARRNRSHAQRLNQGIGKSHPLKPAAMPG